ncbi:MAG: T9SS type A sorting domain-containing protein [Bacteroidales bacterium]
MKKSLLIVLFILLAGSAVNAQTVLFTNDLETWNGNEPVGLRGSKTTFVFDSILPYTASSHSPTHAVQLINSTGTHKRFTTQGVSVTTGTVYTVTFWVRGQGDVRIGLYDQRTTGSGYATYSPWVNFNTTTWTLYTETMTCANTTTTAEFIISIRNSVAANGHIQVDDIEITYGGGTDPSINISSPVENATVFGSSVNVVFAVANFVVGNPGTGIDGHIHYFVDGGNAVMVYNTNPITINGLTAGNHQVVLQLVDNDHNPLSPNVADTVNFTINNSPTIVPIHDIQYTTEASGDSPYVDEVVTTGGIVTGRHASGYFIQSGSGPWNGVYIYDNINVPARGDSVILTGLVAEYFNLTEIKSVTAFGIISSGNAEPEPVEGNCQDINSEQFEGVLLKAVDVFCADISSGFGMWKIQDNNNDTAKVHNLFFTYVPEFMTSYDITGPIYYSFNEYRIEPRGLDDIYVYTGIDDLNDNDISVFPNPARDVIKFDGLKAGDKGTILSITGQIVKSFQAENTATLTVTISDLPDGVYFINFTDYQNRNIRFVKN